MVYENLSGKRRSERPRHGKARERRRRRARWTSWTYHDDLIDVKQVKVPGDRIYDSIVHGARVLRVVGGSQVNQRAEKDGRRRARGSADREKGEDEEQEAQDGRPHTSTSHVCVSI